MRHEREDSTSSLRIHGGVPECPNVLVYRQLGKGTINNQGLLYWVDFVFHTGPGGLLLKTKERRKFGSPDSYQVLSLWHAHRVLSSHKGRHRPEKTLQG